MNDGPLRLPPAYSLDESDPDVVALRRPDSTTAAVFSALAATPQAIEEAAREDLEGRRVPPHPPREHAPRYPRYPRRRQCGPRAHR